MLIVLAGPAAAEQAAMNGVRLGVHPDYTRIVVDLKEQTAPYSVRLSDDRLSLAIITKARDPDGALPPRQRGLIREVQWRSVTNGVVITVASRSPISVRDHGALPPGPDSHYYRIYVDVVPAE